MAEIVSATGIPKRTVERRLASLKKHGGLVRVGSTKMAIGRSLEGMAMGNRAVPFGPSILRGNLKALRKTARMSQADVTKELGVPQNSVWKYESGNAEPEPSLRVILWYTNRFDVTVDALLGRG